MINNDQSTIIEAPERDYKSIPTHSPPATSQQTNKLRNKNPQ